MNHPETGQYTFIDQYVEQKLKPTTISLLDLKNVPATEMINKNRLQGWCWQSATFLSIFFDNEDIVLRGNLTLPPQVWSDFYHGEDYFHSWVELKYENETYVFDPALNYLCKKDDYYKEFNARPSQQVSVLKIRESLINLISDSQEEPVYIPGTNKIDAPFFGDSSTVTVKTGPPNNSTIKELHVRFHSYA